jgi:hypothetical protein
VAVVVASATAAAANNQNDKYDPNATVVSAEEVGPTGHDRRPPFVLTSIYYGKSLPLVPRGEKNRE